MPVEADSGNLPHSRRAGGVMPATQYWVYAYHGMSIAKVHKAGCPHCKNGTGKYGDGRVSKHAEWLGPFDARDAAFACAMATRLRKVGGCQVCHP